MEINWPKITIITPSFNQGQFIESTILSILSQEYPNLEYIIIDGGSTDNTIDVIKKYSEHISYWISESDSGQTNAINKGLNIATGDIVNWLNSDDELAPGALFKIGTVFLENQDCTCFVGRIEFFDASKVLSHSTSIISPLLEQCIGFGKVNQPSMYFLLDCFKKIGFLDERLHYMMDTEWYLRYLMVYGKNSMIDDDFVLSRFRYHGLSKTISQAEEFRFERDSLYYSLALQSGLKESSDFILKISKVRPEFVINLPKNKTEFDVVMAINYFIYQLGLEYYNYRVMKKSKQCFDFVDKFLLMPSEVKILSSRMFRIQYVPEIVWKIKSLF
jgi:glycosyltransferase involved in cell wall biosynthesis